MFEYTITVHFEGKANCPLIASKLASFARRLNSCIAESTALTQSDRFLVCQQKTFRFIATDLRTSELVRIFALWLPGVYDVTRHIPELAPSTPYRYTRFTDDEIKEILLVKGLNFNDDFRKDDFDYKEFRKACLALSKGTNETFEEYCRNHNVDIKKITPCRAAIASIPSYDHGLSCACLYCPLTKKHVAARRNGRSWNYFACVTQLLLEFETFGADGFFKNELLFQNRETEMTKSDIAKLCATAQLMTNLSNNEEG